MDYFGSLNQIDNLVDNSYKNIFEDTDGSLWLPSKNYGVDVIKEDSVNTLHFFENGTSEWIRKIVRNDQGSLFLFSYTNGLIVIDENLEKAYGINESVGFTSKGFMHATVDDQNAIWFGNDRSGLHKFENDTITRIGGLLNNSSYNVLFDDYRNCIWTVSHGVGINRITKDSVYNYTVEDGLKDEETNCIYLDKNGTIWIGFEGKGLQCIDTNGFFQEPKIALSNLYVKSIYQDKNDYLWFSTENGLECARTSSDMDGAYQVSRFTTKDGITTNEYSLNAFAEINDTLYWGGNDGITYLTENPFENKKQSLNISYITINGLLRTKLDNSLRHLELPPDSNYIEVGITNNDHKNLEPEQLFYQLKGLDDKWIEAENMKIVLNHLPHGDFDINLRLGTNGKTQNILQLKINPPIWLNTWMKVVYIVSLALLFLGLFRLRTRQLKKKQIYLQSEIDKATAAIEAQKKQIIDQHIELENSHYKLEDSYREIQDSIAYAKRIQSAIILSEEHFKELLPNSFILYQPKDIVSGDFYWIQELEAYNKDRRILFAVADCTGHGVPGALVYIVCNNELNRAVREYSIHEPGAILTKTRDLILREFEKSEEELKDGMDIALCLIEGNSLKFSGAHNPLWIIRNNSQDILEIKGDKQPIGEYEKSSPFKTHEITVNSGDKLYIFSDGFADQFGGDKGKKYKSNNFKKFLISISEKDISQQKNLISSELKRWKGNFEQLDDVCVLGLEIP